ncbi:MAG: hypothetical protein KFH87_09960 [Bacteroidetes bacterium]|nr:hypothetical protein [Bacteroidota bacterium]
MTKKRKATRNNNHTSGRGGMILIAGAVLFVLAVLYALGAFSWLSSDGGMERGGNEGRNHDWHDVTADAEDKWIQRTYLIHEQFRKVYTAGWEGANGAIGDALLFAVTRDSSLLRFHTVVHPMRDLFNGTWVDDRAWAALAELYWWDVTGRTRMDLVESAEIRYVEAKMQGRLSKHEGYWSWYNWPPDSDVQDQIFTNSNMNQMVNVACRLYKATGKQEYLEDALKVWEGDGQVPGVEKMLYRGDGIWVGARGPAAFGKELPWEGLSYCSIGAAMYQVTKDEKYRDIAVATARRVMDPSYGWVDPDHYYQLRMDGNGAFVHFILDAYMLAPEELPDIPMKVERMLEHVWTNHHGKATVTLHRTSDHGIRNGWNPNGGEDGYGVNEIGTVHPQSQAVRAFGTFVYVLENYVR